MAFMLLINIAAGMISYVGSGYWSTSGISYQPATNEIQDMPSSFNISSAPVEGQTNFGERILDFLSLGLYSKISDFLHRTIFGFTGLLVNLEIITDDPSTLFDMAGFIDLILTIIYTIGIFQIFTGTDLTKK